jgi:hypothetical protein
MMLASTATDWLTALGTVGATVLALGGIFWTRWKRPRLSMKISPRDLDVAPAHYPEGSVPSAWIRARVEAHRATATEVGVSIVRCMVADGDEGQPVERRVATLPLRWSSIDPPSTQLHLRRGAPRLIDIAHVDRREADWQLRLAVDFPGSAEEWVIRRGLITLDLAVTSNDGAASFYTVVLRYDGDWPAGAPDEIWQHLAVVRCVKTRRKL